MIDIQKLPKWVKIEVTKADLLAFAETLQKPKQSVLDNNLDTEFLTIDEAADYLKLARQTMYKMTSKKEITFFKRNKKLYFKKSDLEAWIQQGQSAAS